MSKVSVKNDMWPSFQPIDQPQNSQKRKRTSATTLKDTGNENPVSNKRSRGKRNATTATSAAAVAPSSVTIPKSVVWIGAILMQEEKEKEKSVENEEISSISAAFSIFYGLNDSRNITEKISIKQNQNIDHVYIMGVIRALEKCEDDSSALSIHTGSKVLQSVLDQGKQDEENICDQIKDKIAKRKGTTSIRSATNKEDEFQAAYKLASEKLFEVDAMEIDVTGKSLVDSLEVAENKEDVSVTITTTSTDEVKLNSGNTETVVTTTTVIKEESIATILTDQDKQALVAPPPSWAATLNLRNLLDILKAPFTRNK